MEKTINKPIPFTISCLTSGILSGLIGGVCCCLPVFSGIGAAALYKYIEKTSLPMSRVLLASVISGIIAAVPASLLNMLSVGYVLQNKHLLPPNAALLFENATQGSFNFTDTFISMSLIFIALSVAGGFFYQLVNINRTVS
jgi:hypothetical protein